LGINKKDIHGIIHFNIPQSIENYIQEIGRSGRDNEESECHLFINKEDFIKKRSLCYSDHISEVTVKKLVKKIMEKKEILKNMQIGELEAEFDIKKEVLITIISYMECEKMLKLMNVKDKNIIIKINDQLMYEEKEMSEISKRLYDKILLIEKQKLWKLYSLYRVLLQFSNPKNESFLYSKEKNSNLFKKINEYFMSEKYFDVSNYDIYKNESYDEGGLITEIKLLLKKDALLTPIHISKIFVKFKFNV
jgi:superfamily II DNA helicase RecQ